jgi:hypothetical protein
VLDGTSSANGAGRRTIPETFGPAELVVVAGDVVNSSVTVEETD